MTTAGHQTGATSGSMGAAEILSASPLVARGGFVRTVLLSERARAALAADALQRLPGAETARLERSPDEDLKRGNPARFMQSSPAGAGLRAFYKAPPVGELLKRLTGLRWACSGDRGSWSYYRRAGHYLDLHRDIDACDLAVITCVHERGRPQGGRSGALCLWPERARDGLAAIRADPARGRVVVRLRPAESIVFLGGLIPHRLEPLVAGHVRVVAPLCYQVA